MVALSFNLLIPPLMKTVRAAANEAKSRGWGDSIQWRTLSQAQRQAANEQKPMMLVVHKATCPHCLSLKRYFSSSTAVASLSRSFVMVNLADHEVPAGKEYTPDGHYVPRIMFYAPNGQLLKDVKHDDGQYQYNYPDVGSIVDAMKKVKNEFD